MSGGVSTGIGLGVGQGRLGGQVGYRPRYRAPTVGRLVGAPVGIAPEIAPNIFHRSQYSGAVHWISSQDIRARPLASHPKSPPPKEAKYPYWSSRLQGRTHLAWGHAQSAKKKATNVDLILRTKVQTLGGIYKHFASTRSDRLVSPVVLERCCQCA